MLRSIVVSLALASGSAHVEPAPSKAAIHQEIQLNTSPVAAARAESIYEALLDEKQFTEFSNAPARIQREAGGTFSLFGGRIVGRNVELVRNQRIVQAWRVETWPKGVYSIVRFEVIKTEVGTRIVFDQTGFPAGDGEALEEKWPVKYWEPLRRYLYLADGL